MNKQTDMKISVVTITYNNIKGIKLTAESIINQSEQSFEWIVIDGGSSDGTAEFLKNLRRQPDYWVSEPDGGIYDALNKGISHATGQYVCCMNAGDCFYDSDVLAKVYKQNLTGDIVYGNWTVIERKKRVDVQAPVEMPSYYFFFDHNLCHQAMFVKTTLMKNSPFDTSYRICADLKKWQDFMLQHCSFQYINVRVCVHDNIDGISSDPNSDLFSSEIARTMKEMPSGLRLIAELEKSEKDSLRRKNSKHLRQVRMLIFISVVLLLCLGFSIFLCHIFRIK